MAAEPDGATLAPADAPGQPLTVAAIIPTKNRPRLLGRIAALLVGQTVAPDELIVVDQSESDAGRGIVVDVLARTSPARRPALTFMWDRAIPGAAAARNVGLDHARSDIVICVDDDMVPEPDVIERLLEHYRRVPDVAAITPVITNYTPPPLLDRFLSVVFCRGPFHDDRQPVYWRSRCPSGATLVPVRMLGGGMISVRRAALGSIRFDARYRGASVGEDLDLSWALGARGLRLAIATDARVVHDRGPRPPQRYEEALLTSWGYVYTKHQPKTLANRLTFAWFVTGVFVGALLASLRARSLAPLASAQAGLFNVRNDYRRSSFLSPP